ncbi:MAG: hypothetical protein QOI88_2112, partial [Gammaproteobacteria bacterium]|nr:hypothetical protein [Gammaproteobacteria bacterium]
TKTCSVCHTAIGATEASYATLAPVAVLHTGITAGSCSQCHGSYTAALTWYKNYTPKAAFGLSPSHIPYLVGTDCSSCHASNYATGGFGPTNMSAAKHAFVPTTCNTCHDTGKSFYLGTSTPALQTRPDGTGGTAAYDHVHSPSLPQMTTGDCSQCHNTTAWTTPKTLPGGHMPIPGTQVCAVCHIGGANFALLATTQILHTGITSGCGQCHGGATQLDFYHVSIAANFIKAAAALSPAHIPSFAGNDCSACHKPTYTTGGFGPMNMTQATHASVSNVTCISCHEAGKSFYMGAANPLLQLRPTNHTGSMGAPNDCKNCHTTANWNSTTMPANHMPTPGTQTCSVCHTSVSTGNYALFASNLMLHTGITGNCAQCHGAGTQLSFYNNDMVVKATVPLAPAHIPYISGVDCSSCHKTTTYAAGAFGPMNMTQATHAFVSSTCNTCHGTATVSYYIGAANPKLQLRPADHTSGTMLTGDCGGCHTTANWNSTTLPSGHMPNPANQACAVCHTGAPANYKVFAANSVLHTGITSKCSQCHGTTQLSFYNNDMVVKSAVLAPPHIPFVSGTDCSSCHKTTSYAAGTFGPMNMTQATHAFVATTCNTCHGTTTVAFSMGAANPGMQLRPTNHTGNMAAPADCSGCHTTANWNSGTLPAGHMPNPGNKTCITCHTSAPTNYKVFAANSVMHTGITGNCSQCHGTTQLSFFNNDMVIKSAVLAPPHIPFLSGTDCSSCHKGTTYAAGTFGPMNMTQATHAFVSTTCSTCHGTATVAFFMGAANPGMQLRPKADHTTGTMLTGDCSGCHTTANWNSGTMPAGHMPNPANQACSVCHTAAPANYTTLASILVLHTGISTGCISCHGAPNVAKPVFANNYSPKAASGLSPPHIPSAATPCDSCHTKTYAAGGFSGTTMSSAKHTQLLANTGGTCDQCHDLTTLAFYGVSNLQHRPNGHHVGKDCNGCHGTNNWNAAQVRKTAAAPVTTRTKVGIVANTGLQARLVNRGVLNEPGVHLPGAGLVGGIAGSAALATGAASATGITRVNHAGVIANCVSCHNGVLATGKGPRHIASNNTCENCHTTFAWMPAHFDHRGITATCLSCHNGAAAPGKPTRHIQTNQDCSACHGTIAWAPANFNHLGINATCQSCHNGVAATAKQLGHLATTLDCGSCHSTLNWTTTIQSAPLKPLISRPKPSPRPRGPVNGPAK